MEIIQFFTLIYKAIISRLNELSTFEYIIVVLLLGFLGVKAYVYVRKELPSTSTADEKSSSNNNINELVSLVKQLKEILHNINEDLRDERRKVDSVNTEVMNLKVTLTSLMKDIEFVRKEIEDILSIVRDKDKGTVTF
jgi:peptidoglycan hydrolase CwlO-like protein